VSVSSESEWLETGALIPQDGSRSDAAGPSLVYEFHVMLTFKDFSY